jgi:hypothetical protein
MCHSIAGFLAGIKPDAVHANFTIENARRRSNLSLFVELFRILAPKQMPTGLTARATCNSEMSHQNFCNSSFTPVCRSIKYDGGG